MCSLEKETEIKKVLRSLCFSYGWSFGVFWKFDQRNSMLLALEDAYSMEYAKSLTDDMLLQVHVLGEGVIGQAAFDGEHRWVISDSSNRKHSFTAHAQIQQDNSIFSCEFASGIKTIVVIPVESCGVLQFGSVHEMLESPGFVDQARQVFRQLSLIDGLIPSGNSSSSLITDSIYQNAQFAHQFLQASEFGPNFSSFTDPISTTSNSIPSSSCVENQDYSPGFDPLSFLGGSVDNQWLDSLFHDHELSSTELNQTLLQEHHMDDSVLQWTLNDDLLQSLLAELPSQTHSSNEKETFSELPLSNADLLQSHGFEPHFGLVKTEPNLQDNVFPPKKGLFSELGLDQLLSNKSDSGSFAKSSIEDPIRSPKKRRTDSHLWADKCFIADTNSCITDQTKKFQEASKVTKKRARPGESSKPRPKDRQMIQDRIKELREIIPNGSKCSIDSLLDRTIKHMLFMQGATKYVDKLKRVDEAKAQRDMLNNSGTNGSTAWAIEVGSQNPIVVEDLGNSGQMLIEMICEEQGFFLEIADVIRGFGLTILKGVVEARDDKVWAHFIVEANRHVTRMEVLMSLLQLLKESCTIGSKSADRGNKVFSNKTSPMLNNYHHQPMMSLPVGLADMLR